MFDWLEERVREKDEWRFATMEYGGQCVTMAGIKWMLTSSADNWDMGSQVLQVIIKCIFSNLIQQISSIFQGIPTNSSWFGSGEGPVLLNNVACNASYTHLLECTHPMSIGMHECTRDSIAGVICPKIISFSAKNTLSGITALNTIIK